MTVDLTEVAQLAAKMMDKIEHDTQPGGDFEATDVKLVDAMLVVEVSGVDEDGDDISGVVSLTISNRSTVGIGLATRALNYYS